MVHLLLCAAQRFDDGGLEFATDYRSQRERLPARRRLPLESPGDGFHNRFRDRQSGVGVRAEGLRPEQAPDFGREERVAFRLRVHPCCELVRRRPSDGRPEQPGRVGRAQPSQRDPSRYGLARELGQRRGECRPDLSVPAATHDQDR